jgi:two-component system, chemotaxis family, response regulator WspF
VKVALAEPDSQVARAVERALARSGYDLVWHATTGAETLKRCTTDPPELLLLGLRINDLKPLELTKRIVTRNICAVVLLTGAAGDTSSEYEAMEAGALDVAKAPTFDGEGALLGAMQLLAKLRTAARLLGHSSGGRQGAPPVSAPPLPPLVAIGASTGGPQALSTVLSALPKPFPGAIVIVQHVDGEFSSGLATWLSETSGMVVDLARPGVVPAAGVALLAGTEEHLVMTSGGSLRYTPDPRELPYRPSVDVLFTSLAQHWRVPGMAVLLTGMGRDGAIGMSKLRQAGWLTVAQDEATSVVYGMPKAAVQLGAAMRVLPVDQLGLEASHFVTRARWPRKGKTSKRPLRS